MHDEEKSIQKWMQKIVQTTGERKIVTLHQPFCISKSITCPICHKSFEKEEIGDPVLTSRYFTFSYYEWLRKIDEIDGDYCPFCLKTFDYIYNCLVCGKKIKTNKEKNDNGGIRWIVCSNEECQETFRLEYKKRRCPLCRHVDILSVREDFTMFQLYEENSADY